MNCPTNLAMKYAGNCKFCPRNGKCEEELNNYIKIDYKFTTLNEYINAERGNKYKANKIKQRETDVIKHFVIGKKKITTYPIKITFIWHLTHKRYDLDNVAFAKKFILDGLVKAEILKNDNLTCIQELEDKFIHDDKEFVELIIEEVEEVKKKGG